MDPENEAPPNIDDHAFEPKGHWYTLCIHCGLAESAHEKTRYTPDDRHIAQGGLWLREVNTNEMVRKDLARQAYPDHGVPADAVTRELAPSAELRAAASEALELLDLLVTYGRSVPDYRTALRIKERLRAALAATS